MPPSLDHSERMCACRHGCTFNTACVCFHLYSVWHCSTLDCPPLLPVCTVCVHFLLVVASSGICCNQPLAEPSMFTYFNWDWELPQIYFRVWDPKYESAFMILSWLSDPSLGISLCTPVVWPSQALWSTNALCLLVMAFEFSEDLCCLWLGP